MKILPKCLLVGAIAGLASSSVFAQSTYMNVPGIAGESTARHCEGWIETLSLSQSYAALTKNGDPAR